MKIVLVSTNYVGGASICARRLHQALLNSGYDSHLLVLDKVANPAEKNVHSIEEILTEKHGKLYFKALRALNRLFNKFPTITNLKAYINGPESLFRIDKLELFQSADIIHLNWVPKIISYKHVFADKKKIFFWSQHDMNAFTGGNHYTLDLDDYSPYEKMLQKNIQKKVEYLKGVNLTVISSSVWLAELAKKSEPFKNFEVHVVPTCLDTNVFRPVNKAEARKKLNLPEDGKKHILFVAEKPGDVRKGMNLLLSALNKLKNRANIRVLIVGKKMEGFEADFEYKPLGYIGSAEQLVTCYNAADFFVIPSIEDNLPNTAMEALSCGTPVVGFRIGGIPDIVEHQKTGLLSDLYDEPAFIKNLEYFVDLDNYDSYSENARISVEQKFSEKVVVAKTVSLYLKRYKK